MSKNEKNLATKNTFLDISYEERSEAKKAAGKLKNGENAIHFDKKSKYWYAKPGADLNKLKKWLPDQYKNTTNVKNNPVVEFGEILEAEGFELDGLPVMDGTKQRVKTTEDKKGQKTGVYVGYLDGVPAGWYLDYRKHDSAVKWVSTGNSLSEGEKSYMRATLAQKKLEREEEKQKKYAHISKRITQVYSLMPDADNNHEYLEKKGVKAYPGVKIDKKNNLVIPLQNEEGEIKTLQRINESGFKSLKKDGQKSGSFFIVGGELKDGEPIFYAEGYSTAASISQSINMPVVMAVDAGNLPRVGDKLKNSYPNSLHIFCGDNDHSKEKNTGEIKAKEGAKVTDGIYILPEFTKEEKDKGFTDFNDLHQSRGFDAIRIQIESGIDKYIKKAEMMNDNEKQYIQTAPIITEDFEKEMNAALKVQYKNNQIKVEAVPEPQQAESENIRPGEEQAASQQTQAAPEPKQAESENVRPGEEQAASQQTQAVPEPKQAKFERVHPEPLIPDESIQLFDAEAQAMFDDWMKENEQKRFEQEQKRLEQEQKQLEQKLKQLEQEQAASQQTQAAPEPKQAKFERVHPEPLIPDESIQLFDAEAQAMFDDWMKENEQKRFEQEQKRLEQEQKQLEQKL
uniref:DUF5710 domain-containing protein n=2 Tax=Xenorhabdus sp. KK7.4 TaxID=1851572 RepID=UPI001F4EE314